MRLGFLFLILIQANLALSNVFICEAILPKEYGGQPLTILLFEDQSEDFLVLSNHDGGSYKMPILQFKQTEIGFMDQIGTCINAGVWAHSCIETYFGTGTIARNYIIQEAIQLRESTKHNWSRFDILQAKEARKYFITQIESDGAAGITEYYDLNQNLIGRFYSPGHGVMTQCVTKELKDALNRL